MKILGWLLLAVVALVIGFQLLKKQREKSLCEKLKAAGQKALDTYYKVDTTKINDDAHKKDFCDKLSSIVHEVGDELGDPNSKVHYIPGNPVGPIKDIIVATFFTPDNFASSGQSDEQLLKWDCATLQKRLEFWTVRAGEFLNFSAAGELEQTYRVMKAKGCRTDLRTGDGRVAGTTTAGATREAHAGGTTGSFGTPSR